MPPYCEEHQMYHYEMNECSDLRKAAKEHRAEAARREQAERIARQVLGANVAGGDTASATTLRHVDFTADRVRIMLTDAALQALKEAGK